jgi:hypothetical protein
VYVLRDSQWMLVILYHSSFPAFETPCAKSPWITLPTSIPAFPHRIGFSVRVYQRSVDFSTSGGSQPTASMLNAWKAGTLSNANYETSDFRADS